MKDNNLMMSWGVAFLLVPVVVGQQLSSSNVTASFVTDSSIVQNCNPDFLISKIPNLFICGQMIQYRCLANQTNCFNSWGLMFAYSNYFKPIGDTCPAWRKGPFTTDCALAVKAASTNSATTIMAQNLLLLLNSTSIAPCFPVGGTKCSWGSLSSTLPPPPTDQTGVANTSSVYLDHYLQTAMSNSNKKRSLNRKRAIVSRLSSSDATTQSYLDMCNLSTASTSNDFLAGCLAGLTRFCKSSTLQDCHNYYETVYSNSIYQPIVTCLPWQSGTGSSQCAQNLLNVCVQYGPIANGKPDQGAGPCGFATYSQSKVFRNATYCPQS